LEKSRKWIIRDGFTGISRSGSGAPIASGWKKSLGFLNLLLGSLGRLGKESIQTAAGGGPSHLPPGRALNLEGMEASERDSTRDWLLPEHSRPPLLSELEARIDEALATARASEAAVMAVGAAALDAADQARRAAELAERASAAMLGGRPAPDADEDDVLRDFTARADRVAARLRHVAQVSLATAG
jgi:hypothetical protein